MQNFTETSTYAANFLKSLASPHRLTLLCLLVEREMNVGELVQASNLQQSSVSQHLKILKEEGIIDYVRRHRVLTYRIIDKDAAKIFLILHNRFCPKDTQPNI
jgi:DNA-binding transcriptional ArsR family regulator